MSTFDLINLMTLIQNLPLNSDVAFYNWLKILPPTNAPSRLGHVYNFECGKWASLDLHGVKFLYILSQDPYFSIRSRPSQIFFF